MGLSLTSILQTKSRFPRVSRVTMFCLGAGIAKSFTQAKYVPLVPTCISNPPVQHQRRHLPHRQLQFHVLTRIMLAPPLLVDFVDKTSLVAYQLVAPKIFMTMNPQAAMARSARTTARARRPLLCKCAHQLQQGRLRPQAPRSCEHRLAIADRLRWDRQMSVGSDWVLS